MNFKNFAPFFSMVLATLLTPSMFAQGNVAATTPTAPKANIRAYLDPASANDLKYWQSVVARACAVSQRPEGYDLKTQVSMKEEKALKNDAKELTTLEDAQSRATLCYETANARETQINWRLHFAGLGSTTTKTAEVLDSATRTATNTAVGGTGKVIDGVKGVLGRWGK